MPSRYILSIVFLAVFFSCKKTTSLPAQRQDRILEYKVANLTDSVIYGAIDDDSNLITVYVPFYFHLQVIDPAITVSEGATLQTEPLPVPITDTTASYTIKGKDGSTATYRLKIVIQAPPLVLQELSQPGDTLAYPVNGYILNIIGNFNTLNLNDFSLQLSSDATGHLYPMNLGSVQTMVLVENGVYVLNSPQIPADIESGLYHIHVTMFGQIKAAMTYPIRIYNP